MMADVCELLFAEDIGHQVQQPASQFGRPVIHSNPPAYREPAWMQVVHAGSL
jgi:hypothetical protein